MQPFWPTLPACGVANPERAKRDPTGELLFIFPAIGTGYSPAQTSSDALAPLKGGCNSPPPASAPRKNLSKRCRASTGAWWRKGRNKGGCHLYLKPADSLVAKQQERGGGRPGARDRTCVVERKPVE